MTIISFPHTQRPKNTPLHIMLNAAAAIAAVVLLDLFSPAHRANLHLMPDQDFFQFAGKVWAEGGVPYRDIWDQKGPFIFFVNMLGGSSPATGMASLSSSASFCSLRCGSFGWPSAPYTVMSVFWPIASRPDYAAPTCSGYGFVCFGSQSVYQGHGI